MFDFRYVFFIKLAKTYYLATGPVGNKYGKALLPVLLLVIQRVKDLLPILPLGMSVVIRKSYYWQHRQQMEILEVDSMHQEEQLLLYYFIFYCIYDKHELVMPERCGQPLLWFPK